MATEWYVHRDAGPLGPLTGIDLQRMAANGEIYPASLISKDRKVWHSAQDVRGLKFPVIEMARPAAAAPLDAGVAAMPADSKSIPNGWWWGLGIGAVYLIWLAYVNIPTPEPRDALLKVVGAKNSTQAEPHITERMRPLIDNATRGGRSIFDCLASAEIIEEKYVAPIDGGGCRILMAITLKDDFGNLHAGILAFRLVKPLSWARSFWKVDDILVVAKDGRQFSPPTSLAETRDLGAAGAVHDPTFDPVRRVD